MQYPQKVKIIDVTGVEVFPGIQGKTPDVSKNHIGKEGIAEEVGNTVKITLEDGWVLWGYECWWEPLGEA